MIKLVTEHSYFEKNPTSKWVDLKTTHQLDGCTQNLNMHVLGAIRIHGTLSTCGASH